MKVDIITKNDLEPRLVQALNDARRLVEPGLRISRLPDGSFLPGEQASSKFESVISDDPAVRIVHSVLNDACGRAERIGPGSTRILVNLAPKLLDHPRVADRVIDAISRISKPAAPDSLERCLGSILRDPMVVALVRQAVTLAGSGPRIFVEPTPSIETTVELTVGHTFNISPVPGFIDGTWSQDGVRCFIVDGVILSVSEIDTLLQACNARREPMAIFARGFDPEVMATLRVNWIRGTLRVLPIVVAFDYESLNVLNDIATVAMGDVVSSLKGQLISTVTLDSLPVVQRFSCRGSSVSIVNPGAGPRVLQQLVHLNERRAAAEIQDSINAIDRRIRSLASSTVVVRIAASSGGEYMERMQQVDMGLRIARVVLVHGTVRPAELVRHLGASDPVSGIISSVAAGYDELPTVTLAAAVRFASNVVGSLGSVGAALTPAQPWSGSSASSAG